MLHTGLQEQMHLEKLRFVFSFYKALCRVFIKTLEMIDIDVGHSVRFAA